MVVEDNIEITGHAIMEKNYCVLCNGTEEIRAHVGFGIYKALKCNHTIPKSDFQKHRNRLMDNRNDADEALKKWEDASEHCTFTSI